LWQFVAEAFWYPDGQFLTRLYAPARRDELNALFESSVSEDRAVDSLARVWLAADAIAETATTLQGEYTYLFARQVQVRAYETAYRLGPGADPAPTLAEVSGFYAAFGFQIGEARRERPDHISFEAEFLAALFAKDVYADAKGWSARAKTTQGARRKFIEEHLAGWLPAFTKALEERARFDFYPAVAHLALRLLEEEIGAEALARAAVKVAQPIAEVRATGPFSPDTDFRECPADSGVENVVRIGEDTL
jgi:TorA maturation chaperone TorD